MLVFVAFFIVLSLSFPNISTVNLCKFIACAHKILRSDTQLLLSGKNVDCRMSQKLQKAVDRQRAMGGLTSVRSKASGTASSVTFTPVQGIEIVNPTIKTERFGSSSTTYFSPSATFVKVQTPVVD